MIVRPGLLACAALALLACGSGSSGGDRGTDDDSGALDPNVAAVPLAGGTRPALGDTWQIQLLTDDEHPLNTSYDVDVYDVDLEDTPSSTVAQLKAAGRYVVCYFSAGSFEPFRSDADEFRPADLGNPLDPPFGEERWLDVDSANVHRIMRARLDRAASKGCQAVDPDNVNAFSADNGLGVSAERQLAYNRFIANEAHRRGLAVGLKNDPEQVPELVDYFDFQVNEQCFEFDECDALQPFIDAGKPIFNIEYQARFVNDTGGARTAMCADARAQGRHSLVLPIELDDAFRLSCDL